jgi:hypothetical protein
VGWTITRSLLPINHPSPFIPPSCSQPTSSHLLCHARDGLLYPSYGRHHALSCRSCRSILTAHHGTHTTSPSSLEPFTFLHLVEFPSFLRLKYVAIQASRRLSTWPWQMMQSRDNVCRLHPRCVSGRLFDLRLTPLSQISARDILRCMPLQSVSQPPWPYDARGGSYQRPLAQRPKTPNALPLVEDAACRCREPMFTHIRE